MFLWLARCRIKMLYELIIGMCPGPVPGCLCVSGDSLHNRHSCKL